MNDNIDFYTYLKDSSRKYNKSILKKIEDLDILDNIIKDDLDNKSDLQIDIIDVSKDSILLTEIEPEIIKYLIIFEDDTKENIKTLFNKLRRDYPEVFNELTNYIRELVLNGEVLRVASNFDAICIQSSLVFLKEMDRRGVDEAAKTDFLKSTLFGDEYNSEFNYLTRMLYEHVSDSEQECLEDMIDALRYYYKNGSQEEALDNMRKLAVLVVETGLSFKKTTDTSCYSWVNNTIYLNEILGTSLVAVHELGHAIDRQYHLRDMSVSSDTIIDRAKSRISTNPRSIEIINECNNYLNAIGIAARDVYEETLIETYGSLEEARNAFIDEIVDALATDNLEGIFDAYEMSEELRERIKTGIHDRTIDSEEVTDIFMQVAEDNYVKEIKYQQEESMFLDIISAIYKGESARVFGIPISLHFRHTSDYYREHPDNAMSEIIANMNGLLVSGNTRLLGYVKELAGDDFYDEVIRERSSKRNSECVRGRTN